jgi:23S rRNA (uracil1939-C5)-methyltransferase
MAPFVLPGELVRVEPEQGKPSLVRGRVLDVVESSQHRVVPRCPYFTRCGGCQYQHADYAFQVSQKQEILRETLRRVGKLEWQGEIGLVAGPEWAYRNRIQLHFDGGRMGYHAAGSHEVVDVAECPVSSPKLNEAIASLRGMLGDRRWPWFLRSLELFTNERDVQVNALDTGGKGIARGFFDWCAERIGGAGAAALEYAADGAVFRVSYKSFFQTNRFLIGPLVESAVGGESGARAWDLYAGVGLFSRRMGARFEQVTAVESSASAVSDLRHNVPGALVEHSPADLFLEKQSEAPEFVLADPPRAGLGKTVVKQLARLRPQRLTVVSCDPATLARDLAELLAQGFRIERMSVVDLFPHTSHIETAVCLRA